MPASSASRAISIIAGMPSPPSMYSSPLILIVSGILLSQPGADPPDDLGQEAGPAGQVPAVLVGPEVRQRREEGGDEIAVGAVDVHAVESRRLGPRGRLDVRLDQAGDLFAGQRPRRLRPRIGGNGRRGHGLQPGDLRRDPAAGVVDLEKDPGIVLQRVDGIGQPFEPLDVPLARRCRAAGRTPCPRG